MSWHRSSAAHDGKILTQPRRAGNPLRDVSLNVKRRNLTACQRAMAAAKAWAQGEAEGETLKQG